MATVNTPVNTLGAASTLTQAAVGTVSQLTSITTGVTLDNLIGVVTTQAATAGAAGATPNTFTVSNSLVKASSVVVADIVDYGGVIATNGNPFVIVDAVTNGSFNIIVSNAHGTNALNGTLKIAFQVLAI